jgi:hypothetical protein
MRAVAPLGLAARARRRRGERPRWDSRVLGKGSGAFRAARRTQPWASRWRGSTRERRPRWKGPTVAQTYSSEQLRDNQDNKRRNRGAGRLLTTSAKPGAPRGWRGAVKSSVDGGRLRLHGKHSGEHRLGKPERLGANRGVSRVADGEVELTGATNATGTQRRSQNDGGPR